MEQLEMKQDEEYYEPSMDVGSRARILSRRLKQLNKLSPYDNPEDADNEDSKNELGIKRKKRIRVSARHNNAVQNRMKLFDVGKPKVVETEVQPMRRKLKNTEFLKKIETFGSKGSEEILSSSPAVLAIPRSRAAQRESIRNIKTTLSTRKKNFLHLHNTGFKPQSKSEKEQNIAPTPMPRRKVRVASIKKDEVIKQEAISELIASEDKNIASKEKKVPPKKPPRKLRVSVKRVSTRKSTKGGEIKCKKAGESGERGSTNTIDNGEQRRVSSRQSIKFTESGGKSVSSTNADLYTNEHEKMHLADKPTHTHSFKSVKLSDNNISIRKVRVSRVSRKKIAPNEHIQISAEESNQTKAKSDGSGEKTASTNSPVSRQKASTKDIIANINSFKSSKKQSLTGSGRRHASEKNKNNNENNENTPPKPSRRRYRKKYLKLFMEAAHSGEDSESSMDSCSSEPLQSKKKVVEYKCLSDEEGSPNLSKKCVSLNTQSFRAYDISDIVSGLNASSKHTNTDDEVISPEKHALAAEDYQETLSRANKIHSTDSKIEFSNTNHDSPTHVRQAAGNSNQALNFSDVESQNRSDAQESKSVESNPSQKCEIYSLFASNMVSKTMHAIESTKRHQPLNVKSDQSNDISCNDSLPVYDQQSTVAKDHEAEEEKQQDNGTQFSKYESVVIHTDVENTNLDPVLLKGLEEGEKTNLLQKKQYRDKFLAAFNAAESSSTEEQNATSLEKTNDEPFFEPKKEQKITHSLSETTSLEDENKELATQSINELTTVESNNAQQNVANDFVLHIVSTTEVDTKQAVHGCNENNMIVSPSALCLSTPNDENTASIDAVESVCRKNVEIENAVPSKKCSGNEQNEIECIHIIEQVNEIPDSINQNTLPNTSHNNKEIKAESLVAHHSEGCYNKIEVDTQLNTEPITVLTNLEDISFIKPNTLKNDQFSNDTNESKNGNGAVDESNINYEVGNKVDVDKDIAVSNNQADICIGNVNDKVDNDSTKDEAYVYAHRVDENNSDDEDALDGKHNIIDARFKGNVDGIDKNAIKTKIGVHDDKSATVRADETNTHDGNVENNTADGHNDEDNFNNDVGYKVKVQSGSNDDDKDKSDVQTNNIDVDDKNKGGVRSNDQGSIGNADNKDNEILFDDEGVNDGVHGKNKDVPDKVEVYSNDDDKRYFYFDNQAKINNIHHKNENDDDKEDVQSDDNEDKNDFDNVDNNDGMHDKKKNNDDKVEVEHDDDVVDDKGDVCPDDENDDDDEVHGKNKDDDNKAEVESDAKDDKSGVCPEDDAYDKNDNVADELAVCEDEEEEDNEYEVEYSYLDEDGNEIEIDVADLDALQNYEVESGSDDEIDVEYVYESDGDTDEITVYLDDDGNYVDENGMPVELELDSDDEIIYED